MDLNLCVNVETYTHYIYNVGWVVWGYFFNDPQINVSSLFPMVEPLPDDLPKEALEATFLKALKVTLEETEKVLINF